MAQTVEYAYSQMGEKAWNEGMNPEQAKVEMIANPYTYTDRGNLATLHRERESHASHFDGGARCKHGQAHGQYVQRELPAIQLMRYAMMSAEMPAAVIHSHGAPPEHHPWPVPHRGPGQALVRVTAAPISPLDLLCASGTSYFGAASASRMCRACRASAPSWKVTSSRPANASGSPVMPA